MYNTSLSDLRALLNDNPTDRYCYRKKLFGTLDGTNLAFKSFEFRRVTNFTDGTSSAAPLGVYLDGTRLTPSDFASDNPATGEFILHVAPNDGQILQGTYYTQQFLDAELTEFLTNTMRWLQLGSDITQCPDGLIQAALHNAAAEALRKLAMRWTQRSSDTFLLEDAPKKEALGVSETYMKLADMYSKTALKYRDDNYANRSGQALAPNSIAIFGRVSAVTPRR